MWKKGKAVFMMPLAVVMAIQFSITAFAWPWNRKETEPAETTAQKTTQAETKAAKENKNEGKSKIDIVSCLKLNYSVEFQVSEELEDYINSNLRFFPAGEKDKSLLEKRIDYSLDYKHMNKNPQKYVGKFAYIGDLEVVQIWEDSMKNPKEYDYATRMIAVDGEGNCYYIFYIGKSLDIVEESKIRITAMPVDNSSYTAADNSNRSILTLVMLASVVEDEVQDGYVYEGDAEGDGYGENFEEYLLPESNTRYLTESDLAGFSSSELRIAKNEIYARHGRIFTSEDLNQYFNSKSWYRGTVAPEKFSESVFSQVEKDNILFIQKHIDHSGQ